MVRKTKCFQSSSSRKKARVYGVYGNEKFLLYKGTWTSSDSSVLTVDNNGKIIPKKAGKATVSVKYGDTKLKIKVSVSK